MRLCSIGVKNIEITDTTDLRFEETICTYPYLLSL